MSKSRPPTPPPAEPNEPVAAPEDLAYEENAPPYPEDPGGPEQAYAEGEGAYEEQGQYYDENGQPYYDENGQPYDPNAYPPDYPTAPMGHPQMAPHLPMGQMPLPAHGAPLMHPHMALPMHPLHPHPAGIPMPAPPPSHGGPYRVPPNELPPFQAFPKARVPRPLLGSAVAVYGVLLWSFVVAGQFATSWTTGAPMSQGTAGFLVVVATGAAWGFALQRSRNALPSATMGRFVWRGIGIGALAFSLFLATLFFATIFGQATHGHDFLIAFGLVSTSVAAIVMGPRLTMPTRSERTPRMKLAVISMWAIGVILTFVAGAELATNG